MTSASQSAAFRQRLNARYGGDAVPRLAGWNETLDLLLSHRSVRAFLPDPLPDGTLETLVAAAQSAATSSNLQSWSVVVVEDAARKARLAVLAGNQGFIAQAPLFLVWLADLARIEAVAREAGREVAATACLESFLAAVVDAALAAQNAVTALESLGLGTVYVGAIRNRPVEVAAELGLPPNAFAVFGLAVGRPDPLVEAAVRPRLPQAAVLHRERYGWGEAGREAVATYDEAFRSWQQERGMPAQGWVLQALNRLKGPESLGGRDRLREALAALGFALK